MEISSSSFDTLSLDERVLTAVIKEGYTTPTPIQAQAIPPVLKGHDLLGIAQTGTGKTAAFALPILSLLAKSGHAREPKAVRALVLTPTRELAIQVHESFVAYGRHMPLRNACVFGGVGDAPQKQALHHGVDILVATPGRFLDLMNQGAVHLHKIEVFVLDEADRMLDMGFIHDIRKVVAKLPPQRQSLFFSATMPDEIARLAGTILHKPVRVEVTPAGRPIERIDQRVYAVEKGGKFGLLLHLLNTESMDRVLVFTRTKHGANRVCDSLDKKGVKAMAIHGNKSQTRRQEALRGFKEGHLRVLVATDIASRGIDVDEISHVVNYDVPHEPETFIHRIGRTARAGADGSAYTFCSQDEIADLRAIERLAKRQLPLLPVPEGALKMSQPDMPREDLNGWSDKARSAPQGNRGRTGQSNQGRSGQGNQGRNGQSNQGRSGGQGGGQRNEQRGDQRSNSTGNARNSSAQVPPNSQAAPRNAVSGEISHENHDPKDQWFGHHNKPTTPVAAKRKHNYGGQRKGPQPEYANRDPNAVERGIKKIGQGLNRFFGG